ncbi:hypothetical protein JOM56_009460 [Amanita muscaria]
MFHRIPIHTFLIAARHCYETRILPPPHAAMVQQGLLARISRTGVWEYWHAFGISEGKNSNKHFLICGVQGDFTQGLVNNTPTHIWTHELKESPNSAGSVSSAPGRTIATSIAQQEKEFQKAVERPAWLADFRFVVVRSSTTSHVSL